MDRRRSSLPTALTLAVLLAASACPSAARAQSGRDGWRTYAGGDEVLALAVDPRDGEVLWAGTEGGGVVVWDLGRETYTQHLFPQQAGLASNDVRDIAFEEGGDAWLATPRGVTHAPAQGSWRTYVLDDGLSSLDITAVAVDDDGTVWAGAYDAELVSLGAGDGTWTVHAVDPFIEGDDASAKEGPGSARVADIAVGPDGRVWLAHGTQDVEKPAVSVFDPADGTWHHIGATNPLEPDAVGPATDQVLALAFDREGVLWLGTAGRGVYAYDPAPGSWTRHTESDGTCGDSVWAVAPSADGVWIACATDPAGNGVAAWDGRGWTVLRTTDALGRKTDLPTDVIRALAVDGDVAWLGTNGPGDTGAGLVSVVDGAVTDVLSTAPLAPPSNDVTAVVVDPQSGDLWVGTRGRGVMRLAGDTWTVHTRESTDDALAGDTVTDLAFRGRELWVASTQVDYRDGAFQDGGVSAYDLDAGTWRTPLRPGSSELPDGDVSSLAVDEDGRLWIGLGVATGGVGSGLGVYGGNGVAVYDVDRDRFDDFYVYATHGDGPAGNTVLDLAAAGDAVWIASSYHNGTDLRRYGGGVTEAAQGQWRSWGGGDDDLRTFHGSGDVDDRDPFITGDVRSIAVDSAGRPWAGTWDVEGAQVESLWPYVSAVANHLDGTVWENAAFAGDGWVSAITDDGTGTVWLGTTRGHDPQEVDLATMKRTDTARGGLQVGSGTTWTSLTPDNSGLAGNGITALTVDPRTGAVWVATENNGLSRFTLGTPPGPTNTPDAGSTATSPVVPLPTGPLYYTVPPPTGGATGAAGTREPLPFPTPYGPQPPPEVPEPATLVLVGGGLAALAAWAARRRRRAPADPPGSR